MKIIILSDPHFASADEKARGDYELTETQFDIAPTVIPFAAQTRLSGIDMPGRTLRKGAIDAVLRFIGISLEQTPAAFRQAVDSVARTGGTPLAVAENGNLLGVIHSRTW